MTTFNGRYVKEWNTVVKSAEHIYRMGLRFGLDSAAVICNLPTVFHKFTGALQERLRTPSIGHAGVCGRGWSARLPMLLTVLTCLGMF